MGGRSGVPHRRNGLQAKEVNVNIYIYAHFAAQSGVIRTNENDDGLLVGEYVPKADLFAFAVEHVDVCGSFECLGVDCGCTLAGGHGGGSETSKGCR